MSTHRNHMLTVLATAALTLAMAAPAWAAGTKSDPTAGTIYSQKADQGEVWVNVYLARHRMDASFIPLVVGVRNDAKEPVDLKVSSYALVLPDGTRVPAADIGEVRGSYNKLEFDHRWLREMNVTTVLGAWGVHYVPSRFYPPLTMRGGVQIPIVEVPPQYWSADVIYFKRPAGLTPGTTVTLEVEADGWNAPVRVPITL